MILASSLIGYIFFPISGSNNKVNPQIVILLVSFVSLGFLSAVFSENRMISFLGETQRKNGFATYVSLAIVFYAVAKFIKLRDLNKLEKYLAFVSVLLVIYGFMQSTGKDFVTWNNPYNSVIGTAGNPNFSSAIFAILGIYILTTSLINLKVRKPLYSLAYLGLALLLFISILNTNSLQGVLAFFAGLFVFVLVVTYKYKKTLGYFVALIILGFSFIGVLGILQIGPLQGILYKDSVSVRGFYWRAGIEMLKNHPLTGVGIDNYAAYFNLYRTVDYPLRYGFEVTSSNAHNTFIQHFATGGIFFGLTYLILQIYIFKAAFKLVTGKSNLFSKAALPIFCGWITFQAQSLVSIDNIAISILGWVLGAVIISLEYHSHDEVKDQSNRNSKFNDIKQVITSCAAALGVFVFCTFLFRVETSMFYLRGIYNPSNAENNKLVLKNGQEFFDLPFNNVTYQNQVGVFLAASGYPNEAVTLLSRVLENSPNSLDTLSVLANIYESAKEPKKAIPYRTEFAKLNPWNAKNYLQQGKNYRDIGDYILMKSMLSKIESFASSTEVFQIALSELKEPK
jgi:O-antigen ligase